MDRQAMLKSPPMFPTDLIPNEIVGYENMAIFVTHLRICYSSTNSGEFPSGRLNKEVGAANRERIAKTLQDLRDNGYVPLSVDERGKVRWGVIVKSPCQIEFEKDLPRYQRMPIEELQRLGRTGYLQIRENVTVDKWAGAGLTRDDIMKVAE